MYLTIVSFTLGWKRCALRHWITLAGSQKGSKAIHNTIQNHLTRVQNCRWSPGASIKCIKLTREGTCFLLSNFCMAVTYVVFILSDSWRLRVVFFCLLDHATEWVFFSFTFGRLIFSLLIFSFPLTFFLWAISDVQMVPAVIFENRLKYL